jgi:omega-amidase
MMLTISLAQMNILLGSIEANYARAVEMIAGAKERGSQLILLPELWTSGYDLAKTQEHARSNELMVDHLAEEAAEKNIFIGGSFLLQRNQGLYNTFVLIAPDGQRWQYEKLHLFRLMDEHLWLTPGNHTETASVAGNQIGMAICYDLRFPELFRQYALEGVSLILLPAEWPARRIAHWQVLLKARAIENQVFIAGVNTVGVTGSETFGGFSAVISPWGEMLVEGSGKEEELLTTTIDLSEIDQVRSQIPILSDRRPDIYG